MKTSRLPLPVRIACAILVFTPAISAIELPIELHSWTAAPVQTAVTVNVPATSSVLYLELHNLRYGGQASVQVDSQPWIDLYNHTARVREPDRSLGGIGGLQGTIRVEVTLATAVASGSHTVRFRFNGSNGAVSSFRVLDFDFLNASGAGLLPASTFTQANPEIWTKPYTDQASIDRGRDLFQGNAGVPLVENVVTNRTILASCADCHFRDGSDLHYFNYSNEAIFARSRFHGLGGVDANKVVSYIRSLNDSTANPNPGRPWNPPFQPGAGTDTKAAANWAAGAGLSAAVDSELTSIREIFRPGSTNTGAISFTEIAKAIDHTGNFSVRNIPIGFQFPDWNSWLPPASPKDIWPSGTYRFTGSAAENAYYTLDGAVDTQTKINNLKANAQLRSTVTQFQRSVNNWLATGCTNCEDTWRVYASTVLNARSSLYTGEEAKFALVRWVVTKMFEVVQLRGLMDETAGDANGTDPMYRGEVLGWPANVQNVFFVAPHYTADSGSNVFNALNINYAWQEQGLGKLQSHQWYQLQLVLNSGMRQRGPMNAPVDWQYQIEHAIEAGDYGNLWSGMRQLISRMKLYETRDNGTNSTDTRPLIDQNGFSPRTTHPWLFFSDNRGRMDSFKGDLERLEPDLWRKLFEEFLHEYLDVLEALDLSDTVHVPRGTTTDKNRLPPSNTAATAYTGGVGGEIFNTPDQNHCNNSYRLLPLADAEGVDKLTLLDFAAWAQKAWPGPSTNPNDFAGQVNLTRVLFSDNFEDNTVAFAGYTTVAIKTAAYVNNTAIAPRNGGGRYVAQRAMAANATQSNPLTVSKSLGGATQVRVRARVAFDLSSGTPVSPEFKMGVGFNGGTTVFGAALILNTGLMEKKFVTYERTINVPAGSTTLTRVELNWFNPNAASGTAYVDNVEVVNISPSDSPAGAPGVPTTPTVTAQGNRISLNWGDVAAADRAGYNVYRWQVGEAEATKQKLNASPLAASAFEDYAVQSGVQYRYKVSTADTSGNESAQSAVSAAVAYNGNPLAPWPPNDLVATSVTGSGQVDLTWFASPAWDIAGYRILRKASTASTYTVLAGGGTTPVAGFKYSDATANVGATYDYKVLAIDRDGNTSDASPYDAIVRISVP